MTYIRFKEHRFELEPPDEYRELYTNYTSDQELIEKTWYLDKPVSRVYKDPDDRFIELLKEVFHVYVDDEIYNGCVGVTFSRLPELPEMTANLDTAAEGILFGFPARDVASFIDRDGDTISPE